VAAFAGRSETCKCRSGKSSTGWARDPTHLGEKVPVALEALQDSLPSPIAAPAIAYAAAAAYSRVPGFGCRDERTGDRLVELLAAMGEAGAQELVRLQQSVAYVRPRRQVEAALVHLGRQLETPLGELEDLFAGVQLDAQSPDVDRGRSPPRDRTGD
jgi:hypothetical protein